MQVPFPQFFDEVPLYMTMKSALLRLTTFVKILKPIKLSIRLTLKAPMQQSLEISYPGAKMVDDH